MRDISLFAKRGNLRGTCVLLLSSSACHTFKMDFHMLGVVLLVALFGFQTPRGRLDVFFFAVCSSLTVSDWMNETESGRFAVVDVMSVKPLCC